jgi:hypothetical protein
MFSWPSFLFSAVLFGRSLADKGTIPMLQIAPFQIRGRSAAIFAAFSAASAMALGGAVIAPTVAHADATSPNSPVSTQRPALTGSAAQGSVITVTPGTFSNETSQDDTWYQCPSAASTKCTATSDQGNTYTVGASDAVGDYVRLDETATNASGTNTVWSNVIGPVTAAAAPAAPALTQSGNVLHWNAMAGVSSYTVATILNPSTTRNTTYQTVTGTSFTPPAVAGQTVKYGLQANGSADAPWATEATINWPASTTTSPPPADNGKMVVGVNSLIEHDYIGNLTNLFENAGVNSDRIDVGDGSSISLVTSAISKGLKPLVLYNPSSGQSPAAYASQVQSLATRIKALGLTKIEFVNEPDINHWTPQTYAAAYAAAHSAISGMGMTLIAYTIGDYQRADGTWSQDANGGGWMRDFVAALPAPGASMVDAWSAHLYGNSVTTVEPQDSGWAALTDWRSIEESLGSNAPWYITEIGWNTTAVSTSTQAANTTTVLNSALAKGYVAGVWFYTVIDDSTGSYGLFNLMGGASSATTSDERPAFTSMATWMASHTASTNG